MEKKKEKYCRKKICIFHVVHNLVTQPFAQVEQHIHHYTFIRVSGVERMLLPFGVLVAEISSDGTAKMSACYKYFLQSIVLYIQTFLQVLNRHRLAPELFLLG